jgi:predicted HTH domain antitoxin
MSVQLDIPDTVTEAMRVPLAERKQRLMMELAVSLYAQGILSFGKARELASLGKLEFGLLLGQRHIPRHYTAKELDADLAYARR